MKLHFIHDWSRWEMDVLTKEWQDGTVTEIDIQKKKCLTCNKGVIRRFE